MEPRLDYTRIAPEAIHPMLGLEQYVQASSIEPPLLHLVKLRASQINGCAYCVDMHSKDARAEKESEQRLYALAVWREAPFFTDRERAAFAWTEALTRISDSGVSDALYASVREHFSEREMIDLSLAVVAINGWNRLAISFRPVVGAYQPGSIAVRSRADEVPAPGVSAAGSDPGIPPALDQRTWL